MAQPLKNKLTTKNTKYINFLECICVFILSPHYQHFPDSCSFPLQICVIMIFVFLVYKLFKINLCCSNTLWCVIFQWRILDWLTQHCIYSSRKLRLLLPAANNYHSMSIYASRYDCVFHSPTHAEIWSYYVQIWDILSQSLWIPIYSWPIMFRRQCSFIVTPTTDFLHTFPLPSSFSLLFPAEYFILLFYLVFSHTVYPYWIKALWW